MRNAISPASVRLTPRHGVRGGWRDVVFTVALARRALPYVACIARDASDAFRIVQESREALGQVAVIADRPRRRALCEERDRALTRLNNAIDDCNAVGAHLIDIAAGEVSLPCEIQERPVSLLWRLGEDVAMAWHELLAE